MTGATCTAVGVPEAILFETKRDIARSTSGVGTSANDGTLHVGQYVGDISDLAAARPPARKNPITALWYADCKSV